VATLPQWLKLRTPSRDTVLYPAVAYPTYEMGAVLAGLRAVAVPVDEGFHLDLGAISEADAKRALVLWVNSPGNPAGQLEDLDAAAAWGRARGVLVASDECYAEFTWARPPTTILDKGNDPSHTGVLAVHSLSKRSNLAGARIGWYAGDRDVVVYLREVRKHAGFMVPGPVQRAGVAALGDQDHVEVQRARYRSRLVRLAQIFTGLGIEVGPPDGGFYLWARAPGGDAWALTERLAADAGMLVSPGDFYGAAGAGHVRVAAVAPMERIELVAERLGL
jgi:aspartate/methionine/tyrosine aminotransferase